MSIIDSSIAYNFTISGDKTFLSLYNFCAFEINERICYLALLSFISHEFCENPSEFNCVYQLGYALNNELRDLNIEI